MRVDPRPPRGRRLNRFSGAGLGVAVVWLSLLVLLPLAAVVAKAGGAGLSGFTSAFTNAQSLQALRLTLLCAFAVTVVNVIMGTLIAWVLVRDEFPGQRVIEVLIDIPFALPTIVAGIVMLKLYGHDSPVGLDWYATKKGVIVALLFVTLPFVVRSVQPVLESLERDVEEAAGSLGAGPITTFRRIVLPALAPAILSGAALAFGRAMGEYGSVILIGGGLAQDQRRVAGDLHPDRERSALPGRGHRDRAADHQLPGDDRAQPGEGFGGPSWLTI